VFGLHTLKPKNFSYKKTGVFPVVLRTVNQTKLILVINYLDGGTSLTGTAGQVRDEFRLSYRYVAIVFIMAIYETVINNVT